MWELLILLPFKTLKSGHVVNTQKIILVVITWTLVMSEHETLSRDYPFWLRSVAEQWVANALFHKCGAGPFISLM